MTNYYVFKNDYLKKIETQVEKLINHEKCYLTKRGNSSINAALKLVSLVASQKKILIPDQGGWISYQKYPSKHNLEIFEIKTNDSVIDIEDLKKQSLNAGAIIFENPSGYFASEEITKIYKICKKNKCILILDCSGSLGDKELCNGAHADIIIASLGKGKAVDHGKCGIISFSKRFIKSYEKIRKDSIHDYIFNYLLDDEKIDLKKLNKDIKNAGKRLEYLYIQASNVKIDLNDYDIIHRDKKGIVVVVGFSNIKQKKELIEYCENKGYEYTICPRYIRVNRDAISIELKRISLEKY